jgi:hypothetical protein
MGEILHFKQIFVTENSNKSQKITFWKEKKVENVVTIESLSFNSSMKIWDLPLMLLERSWWVGFSGIYFVSSGLRMWNISKFKWILSPQIQIITKNQNFETKFSIENMVKFASHI